MPDQYLLRHAEPEVALIEQFAGGFQHLIAMPACDEDSAAVLGLLSRCRSAGVLCVVVVNGSDHHPAELHARNAALLASLIERCAALPLAAGAWLGRHGDASWLLIDRCSPGRVLGRRHGVGLARRIGADVGCALWRQGRLASRWLHMSDADALLPEDYFEAAMVHAGAAVALTYPYRHRPSGDDHLDRAHAIYELYLRYYVLGLRAAGSPYALHTIGSTLAADAVAYAKVRGVPKRPAAEDFYLVNKLAKLGTVASPACAPIELRARRSERVPFGTGRATASILADDLRWQCYHPDIFMLLGTWLRALESHRDGPPEELLAASLAELRMELGAAAAERVHQAVAKLDPGGLPRALAGAPTAQRSARLHAWLDAFRTRKLVHALRDGGLASLPWWQALSAPFCALDIGEHVPLAQLWDSCERLAQLERATAIPRAASR